MYAIRSYYGIHSPYKEKFSVPRQPGLVTAGPARLQLLPPFDDPLTLEGITQFSSYNFV